MKQVQVVVDTIEARRTEKAEVFKGNLHIGVEQARSYLSDQQEKNDEKEIYDLDSLGLLEDDYIGKSVEIEKQSKEMQIEEETNLAMEETQTEEKLHTEKEMFGLKHGDVYYVNIGFHSEGKERPVVITQDHASGEFYAHKLTKDVDSLLNHENGYEVKDLEQAGLPDRAVIKVNKEDIYGADLLELDQKAGELSQKDRFGLLLKHLEVSEKEEKKDKTKEKRKEVELER